MHTIDAQGKSMGRVATEAARFLMGKDSPAYERNVTVTTTVHVTHASKMRILGQRTLQKTYHGHSGFLGGGKKESLQHVIAKKGYGEALRRAVRKMLPANKLRPDMLSRLNIEE